MWSLYYLTYNLLLFLVFFYTILFILLLFKIVDINTVELPLEDRSREVTNLFFRRESFHLLVQKQYSYRIVLMSGISPNMVSRACLTVFTTHLIGQEQICTLPFCLGFAPAHPYLVETAASPHRFSANHLQSNKILIAN